MRPTPVQRPRIPIWTAGYWPGTAPFLRAARWDGVAPLRRGRLFEGLMPEGLAACLALVAEHRDPGRAFEAIYFHVDADDGARVDEYEEAGATWWLESTNPATESLAEFRARILAGPPRA
jgi:hypothetical protein